MKNWIYQMKLESRYSFNLAGNYAFNTIFLLSNFEGSSILLSGKHFLQVELVHAQLQRAKDRVHMPDVELYNDLASIYNKSTDLPSIDPSLLHKLADKLQLMSISDLKQESLALHELVAASDGRDPGENIEKMSMLLKKIKDFVLTNNLEMSTTTDDDAKHLAPVIPDDFRCPISLELMEDPVIVASGQVMYHPEHFLCSRMLFGLSLLS